jgi:hypothetical protein
LRNQLAAEVPRFDSLLRRSDSAEAAMSVEVLRAMARSSDTVLTRAGVETLVRFINEDSGLTDKTLWKYRSALRAIGSSSYIRALPTLDSLLKSRIADKPQSASRASGLFSDMIRDQILRTARQANATVGTRNGADRRKLLATLTALETAAPELTALKDELKEATKELAGCDSTTSGVCNGKEEAFKAIEENPTSEDGYRDLYSHYTGAAQYRQATDTFQLLRSRFKNSIWPRKILSEIDHEARSLKDTAAFERAYNEMVALRKLDAYDTLKSKAPEDYVRVESDFVEIALSARRYAEADSVARRLMADTARPVDRLNMSLFIYMAAVMQHDAAAANARLTELESIIRALPPNHYNNWVYPGTLAFIDRSDLAPPLRRALRDLCKEGQWYTQQRAADVIAENRSALATLQTKGT